MFKFVAIIAIIGLVAADNINRDAETKSLVNDIGPDGTFQYGFDTTNGIAVKASGSAAGTTGSAQWISPEGVPVSISYVADANGYQATGDFVPKTPAYVLRAIEWIKAHPQKEEYVQKVVVPQRLF